MLRQRQSIGALFIALLIITLVGTSAAYAYSVSPLRLRLQPFGSEATGQLAIKNTASRPATLSATAYRIDISNTGAITETPEDDDLLVFPPQMILAPGQSQVVQIRYLGDPEIKQARLFSVRVEQEPVNMNTGEQSKVKMAVDFRTAIYIVPEGAVPDLIVVSFAESPDGNNLTVAVRNAGNDYLRADLLDWRVTGKDGATRPITAQATDFGETANIPPGGTRTMLLPRDATGPAASIASLAATAS